MQCEICEFVSGKIKKVSCPLNVPLPSGYKFTHCITWEELKIIGGMNSPTKSTWESVILTGSYSCSQSNELIIINYLRLRSPVQSGAVRNITLKPL
jgi:hypothetical protein